MLHECGILNKVQMNTCNCVGPVGTLINCEWQSRLNLMVMLPNSHGDIDHEIATIALCRCATPCPHAFLNEVELRKFTAISYED